MKFFFGKKEEHIIEMFKKHLDLVDEGIKLLTELAETYMEGKCIEELTEKVRAKEQEADLLRRDVETIMYKGAFLPNFRGDLLGIIESVDKVINKAETVADIFYIQKPSIPEDFKIEVIKQMGKVDQTYLALREAIKQMFENVEKVPELIKKVEVYEHEEDVVEKGLIKKIFESNIGLAEKMQLKDLILNIGDIADRAEDSSDRVEIVMLKRSI